MQAEVIIQYARQVQIRIRKILSAGDAAYRPGRGDGSAPRRRSLISTIALLSIKLFDTNNDNVVCRLESPYWRSQLPIWH